MFKKVFTSKSFCKTDLQELVQESYYLVSILCKCIKLFKLPDKYILSTLCPSLNSP